MVGSPPLRLDDRSGGKGSATIPPRAALHRFRSQRGIDIHSEPLLNICCGGEGRPDAGAVSERTADFSPLRAAKVAGSRCGLKSAVLFDSPPERGGAERSEAEGLRSN